MYSDQLLPENDAKLTWVYYVCAKVEQSLYFIAYDSVAQLCSRTLYRGCRDG